MWDKTLKTNTTKPQTNVISPKKCPRCGMQQKDWGSNQGEGVIVGAVVYCCAACANNVGCSCMTI